MKQTLGDGRTALHGYSADGERVGSYDSVAGGITYVLRGIGGTLQGTVRRSPDQRLRSRYQ
jgi:hypothetical protein